MDKSSPEVDRLKLLEEEIFQNEVDIFALSRVVIKNTSEIEELKPTLEALGQNDIAIGEQLTALGQNDISMVSK